MQAIEEPYYCKISQIFCNAQSFKNQKQAVVPYYYTLM